ncbi:hypothetical protein BC830DRAFT_1169155 [Chytriomyces sp. MP71]|nr:hypothetical protein BC830DRAFT_1169155 [Chytriomyces sp. MP71]
MTTVLYAVPTPVVVPLSTATGEGSGSGSSSGGSGLLTATTSLADIGAESTALSPSWSSTVLGGILSGPGSGAGPVTGTSGRSPGAQSASHLSTTSTSGDTYSGTISTKTSFVSSSSWIASASASALPTSIESNNTKFASVIAPPPATSPLSSGAIAGIAVAGAVIVVALLFVAGPTLFRRGSRSQENLPIHSTQGPDVHPNYINRDIDFNSEIAVGLSNKAATAATSDRDTHTSAAILGGAVLAAGMVATSSSPSPTPIQIVNARERRPSAKSTYSSGSATTSSPHPSLTALPVALTPFLAALDDSQTCQLHPFASEPHSLKDCYRYRRLAAERRFAELEAAILAETEMEAAVLASGRQHLSFPVNPSGPCALHPSATGAKTHTLGECTTYRTLVKQKRFAELDAAFKKSAAIVEAVEPFVASPGVFMFLKEDAACALHPTATGTHRHILRDCYTYKRLVAAGRFDELEERLAAASQKVDAVKKVTFSGMDDESSSSDPALGLVAAGAITGASTLADTTTSPPPPARKTADAKSIRSAATAQTSYYSAKSSVPSGRGYDPSMSGYSGSTTRVRRPSGIRLLKLNRAGNWWRDATRSSRGGAGGRAPLAGGVPAGSVVLNRAAMTSGGLAVVSEGERSVSSRSSSTGRGFDTDAYETAPEYLSTAESMRTVASYRTARGARSETEEEYFTAVEESGREE